MTVAIRLAEVQDAAEIGELTEHAYRVDGLLNVEGSEMYAGQLRDAAKRIRGATVLVAELDGRIMATVTLAAYGSPLAQIAGPDELEVRMLAVALEVRRRGIAEQLMTAAQREAQSRGLSFLVLSSEAPMLGAHRLYEKLRYIRQPERDWSVAGYKLLVYRGKVSSS